LMGYGRGAMCFVWPARRGWFANQTVVDATVRLASWIERVFAGAQPSPGAIRVDVWGRKDRADQHRLICGTGTMREATGLSLAVGALMLARRELTGDLSGVVAPEACLDPRRFIERLRACGIEAYEDLAMTRPVV